MYLLYPERRRMRDNDIVQWAFDRRVDKALADAGLADPAKTPFDDPAIADVVALVTCPTLEEAVAELTDAGVATFMVE